MRKTCDVIKQTKFYILQVSCREKNKFNKENIVKLLLFRVYLSIITVQLGMLSDLLGINKHVSVSKFVLKYRANIKYMYGIVTEYTSNRLLE